MATVEELIRRLRRVRSRLNNHVPELVAEAMLEETHDNFEREQYGNDGVPKPWPNRMGYLRRKGMVNAEPYLNYKKLDYTGKLQREIYPVFGLGYAGIKATADYAEAHNTGSSLFSGGNSFRRPPYASEPIRLGSHPQQRQFMGIGARTIKNTLKIYRKEFRILS